MPSSKKMQLRFSTCNLILLYLGAFIALLGVISLAFFSNLYDYIFTSALALGPDTKAFKAWQKPITPITMDIYFFNWTNPEDIYNSSIKPNFEEVGPYRYKQLKEKINLTWNNENHTITYQYLKHFYFDEENSPCHDSDVITTINMVALSAAHMASDWNILLKQTVKISLFTSNIYVQKTVRELLFDGYEDSILATANAIPFLSEEKVDRFGWFYGVSIKFD
ncbi:hypothetical protein ILUMI_18969 [Ignelater luminosus]|uniref:Uncharacterized protein n=1 Tax=Ignelater luminosus TaxID=2038154 RepID=A0A8K0G5W6_IGNLU|nr:hypothetical protein ILUMI_18969 [Ignelater luminosus]